MTLTSYIKTDKSTDAFNVDDRQHLLLVHRSEPFNRRKAETKLCLNLSETTKKCPCIVLVFFPENSVFIVSMLPSTQEDFEVLDVASRRLLKTFLNFM